MFAQPFSASVMTNDVVLHRVTHVQAERVSCRQFLCVRGSKRVTQVFPRWHSLKYRLTHRADIRAGSRITMRLSIAFSHARLPSHEASAHSETMFEKSNVCRDVTANALGQRIQQHAVWLILTLAARYPCCQVGDLVPHMSVDQR